jgi:hypothetical protein
MLRLFPIFQVVTTCFSCSPPEVNLVANHFHICIHVNNHCHRVTTQLQLIIIIIIIIIINFTSLSVYCLTRYNVVGIATHHGLDVRGSKPRGVEVFRTHPDSLWGQPSLIFNVYRVTPAEKAAETWCWPLTSSNIEIKEIVKLCLYTPYGTT